MSGQHGDLELSIRGAKLARRVGATTVGELARMTENELLSGSCFGETGLRDIKAGLAQRGLRLGMTADELRGRPGLDAKVVRGDPVQPDHVVDETPCCGHCEDAARKLRDRKYNLSLAELELSVRTTNLLEAEGLTTVHDVVIRRAEELLEIRGFDGAGLTELKAKLAERGLQLGTALSRSASSRMRGEP